MSIPQIETNSAKIVGAVSIDDDFDFRGVPFWHAEVVWKTLDSRAFYRKVSA